MRTPLAEPLRAVCQVRSCVNQRKCLLSPRSLNLHPKRQWSTKATSRRGNACTRPNRPQMNQTLGPIEANRPILEHEVHANDVRLISGNWLSVEVELHNVGQQPLECFGAHSNFFQPSQWKCYGLVHFQTAYAGCPTHIFQPVMLMGKTSSIHGNGCRSCVQQGSQRPPVYFNCYAWAIVIGRHQGDGLRRERIHMRPLFQNTNLTASPLRTRCPQRSGDKTVHAAPQRLELLRCLIQVHRGPIRAERPETRGILGSLVQQGTKKADPGTSLPVEAPAKGVDIHEVPARVCKERFISCPRGLEIPRLRFRDDALQQFSTGWRRRFAGTDAAADASDEQELNESLRQDLGPEGTDGLSFRSRPSPPCPSRRPRCAGRTSPRRRPHQSSRSLKHYPSEGVS